MPIFLRDDNLEQLVKREQQRRGDATLARTAANMIRERFYMGDGDKVDAAASEQPSNN